MRIRGNITTHHPCNNRGTPHDVIYTADSNSIPLVFDNQSILPHDMWTCQCECNEPNASDFVMGKYCEDHLNVDETKCYYECIESRTCREVLNSWHAEYVYSAYPNTYTDDPRAMYEDMQLRTTTRLASSRLSNVLRGGGFFMCMDSAISSNPVTKLSGGDRSVEEIQALSSSSLSKTRAPINMVSVLLVMLLAFFVSRG